MWLYLTLQTLNHNIKVMAIVFFFYFATDNDPIIRRPGQSQGLLYKNLCHWLNNSVGQPFPPTAPTTVFKVKTIERFSYFK